MWLRLKERAVQVERVGPSAACACAAVFADDHQAPMRRWKMPVVKEVLDLEMESVMAN